MLPFSLLGKWKWGKAGGGDRQIPRVVVIKVPWQKELNSLLNKGVSSEQCGVLGLLSMSPDIWWVFS